MDSGLVELIVLMVGISVVIVDPGVEGRVEPVGVGGGGKGGTEN